MNQYPSAAAQVPVTGGVKPSWQGLKTGNKSPLIEFVGRLIRWESTATQWGQTNISFSFDSLQVINADQAYAYPVASIDIKYSDRANSGWGKLGKSIADVLQVDMEFLDIDSLTGQTVHWVRHDDVEFGFNRETNEKMVGSVWEMVALVQPGQQVVPRSNQPAQGAPAVASAPTATAGPVASTVVGGPNPDPRSLALSMLEGKNRAEFYGEAMPHPAIRADAALTNELLNDSFIQSAIASGRVVEGPDGRFVAASPVA